MIEFFSFFFFAPTVLEKVVPVLSPGESIFFKHQVIHLPSARRVLRLKVSLPSPLLPLRYLTLRSQMGCFFPLPLRSFGASSRIVFSSSTPSPSPLHQPHIFGVLLPQHKGPGSSSVEKNPSPSCPIGVLFRFFSFFPSLFFTTFFLPFLCPALFICGTTGPFLSPDCRGFWGSDYFPFPFSEGTIRPPKEY